MKRGMILFALASVPLLADDVHLRGGGQITGEIVERTAETVTVDIGGGTLTVRMSNVASIEAGTSPLQVYRGRAATVAEGDLEGWRELARWAQERVLVTQSREAWTQVLALAPDDPEANAALGRVFVDGRWVTEEEGFRARGYVEFEGEWMTPAERQMILEDRRAREEADRQAMAELMAAEQQEAMEREAQEQAERDERWDDDLPYLGDPIYWGWGAAPVYWPAVPAQPARPVRPARPATLPARGLR